METRDVTTRGRGGRPAAGREHEVTQRLLAAATRLFLDKGYEGTTCDQVALDARAGKASIYTRYANKEALLAAVIENLVSRPALVDPSAAAGDDNTPARLRQRLAATGQRMLGDALAPDTLALLRLVLAQHPRFAGKGMDRLFWKECVRRIAAVLAPAASDDAAVLAAAERFVELTMAPLLLRALMGEESATLLARCAAQIDDAIAVLEADGTLARVSQASTQAGC